MRGLGYVVVALLLVTSVVSVFQLFSDDGPVGSEHLIGKPLPQFAAPLAAGGMDADSNIYTRPQAKAAKSTAACDVNLAGAFNSCRDLKGRAIVTFWHDGKKACEEQTNRLDKFASTHTDVKAAAVSFGDDRKDALSVVSRRGWRLPVPVDRDGAVAAIYGVKGCPTTHFAVDGVVRDVRLGLIDEADFEAWMKRDDG